MMTTGGGLLSPFPDCEVAFAHGLSSSFVGYERCGFAEHSAPVLALGLNNTNVSASISIVNNFYCQFVLFITLRLADLTIRAGTSFMRKESFTMDSAK